jgi:starvation-inducible DNA-binding protein
MAHGLRKAPAHDISKDQRTGLQYTQGTLADENVIEFLNTLLADEYTTFTKTLNYHWNLTGPQFHSLHLFLGDQYREQLDTMDEVAERVRVLGRHPLSTVTEMVAERTLSERTEKDLNSQKMLANLYEDHLNIQMRIREFLQKEEALEKDPGTQDFLITVLKRHEMVGWKLKSHLQ